MCCFLGTARTGVGWLMPGRNTTTGTFPIKIVLENDLFGGEDRGAVGTGFEATGGALGAVEEGFDAGSWSSPATVSWRS